MVVTNEGYYRKPILLSSQGCRDHHRKLVVGLSGGADHHRNDSPSHQEDGVTLNRTST